MKENDVENQWASPAYSDLSRLQGCSSYAATVSAAV